MHISPEQRQPASAEAPQTNSLKGQQGKGHVFISHLRAKNPILLRGDG